MEEGVMEDVIAQQAGSAMEKEVSTGKENHVGQPEVIGTNMPCTSTLSAHLSLPPRAHLAEIPSPLAEIPHHLINHGSAEFKALKIAQFPSRLVRRAQWKPPDKETFKINFDGAIFAADKSSSLGVIIRDSKGLVMASMAARISQQLQPVEIKALAANIALVFARELDIKDVVLEGDSL
nr:hypothetical protein CFP56_12661 [Quercus suber]